MKNMIESADCNFAQLPHSPTKKEKKIKKDFMMGQVEFVKARLDWKVQH